MKLATYLTSDGTQRIGGLVDTPEGPHLAGLDAGMRESQREGSGPNRPSPAADRLPDEMQALLALGQAGLDDARRVLDWATQAAEDGGVRRLVDAGVLTAADDASYLPVVTRPGKVICAGMNYADHLAEGADAGVVRPERPAAFVKFASSLVGHEQPISYPAETGQLDYEAELALVIGRTAVRVDRSEALDYVAGYTILNDVSSRDVQFEEMKAGMLLLGKNAWHGTPLGPWLVTPDEGIDPRDVHLELTVNGDVRQSGSTRDLLFGCDELIAYWSTLGLEPGDVISTGTPAGVGIFMDPPERYLLKDGDVVEVALSGIGTLRNRVEA